MKMGVFKIKCAIRYVAVFAILILSASIGIGQIHLDHYLKGNFIILKSRLEFVDVAPVATPAALEQIIEGKRLFQGREYSQALKCFNIAMQLDPQSSSAYYYRGVAKAAISYSEDAIVDFKQAIRLDSNFAEAYYELGRAHLRQGHITFVGHNSFADIRHELETAIALNPKLADAYYLLGVLYYEDQKIARGNRLLDQCLSVDPKYARVHLFRIVQGMRNHPNEKTLQLFDQPIQCDPNFAENYFWRGLVYLKMGDNANALKDWDTALQKDSSANGWLALRGELKAESGDFVGAFNDIKKALLRSDIEQDYYGGGTSILNEIIGFKIAAKSLNDNQNSMDEKCFNLLRIAFCQLISGKNKESILSIKTASDIQQSATCSYFNALNYENLDQFDSAYKYYDRTIMQDNTNFDAHKKRGFYRCLIKDWKGAYEDLNELKRIEPTSYQVYRLSGEIKLAFGDFYGCIVDVTHYLKFDSTSRDVLAVRAKARTQVEDFRGAIQDYMRILNYDSIPTVYIEIAKNFVRLDDKSAAISICMALLKQPDLHDDDKLALLPVLIDLNQLELYDQQRRIFRKQYLGFWPVQNSWLTFMDARVEMVEGNYKSAIRKLDESIRLRKEDPSERMFYRGKAYKALGKVKEAKSDFRASAEGGYLPASKLLKTLP